MRLNEGVWTKLNESEKKLALKKLNWYTVQNFIFLAVYFAALVYYFVELQEPISYEQGTVEHNTVIFIAIVIAISLALPAARMTAAILEKKAVKGKYNVFDSVLLLALTLFSSGLNLILGLICQSFVRKRVVKKIKPDLLKKTYEYNDEADGNNDNKSLKALQALSDGIKLEKSGNYQAAKSKYEQAYYNGDGRGAYYLARMYEEGIGRTRDLKTALAWEKKAADKGVSISQYYLAIAYLNGQHLTKNIDLGMDYMKAAANQEEYDALFYLGLKHGSSLQKDYFNLAKAEDYLIRACRASENDEEKSHAFNELGRLWMGLWSETNDQTDFKMALQLFKKSKDLDLDDAKDNYRQALEMRPQSYASEQVMISDWLVDAYIYQHDASKFKEEPVSDSKEAYAKQDSSYESQNEQVFENAEKSSTPRADLEDYANLRRGLMMMTFIKILCFSGGFLIIRYGLNNGEALTILLPFVIIGGIVVAGLPGLPKAFNDAYNFNQKWDRFFKMPQYKAVIDSQRRTVKIKKNDDWFSIIYVTLLNLIKTAMAIPFEVIRDIYRIIVISKKIKGIGS